MSGHALREAASEALRSNQGAQANPGMASLTNPRAGETVEMARARRPGRAGKARNSAV